MERENNINELFKSVGTMLAVILPFIQFGFVYLPESISSLYIDKGTFFFTSLFTLLLSLFIFFAYKSNPHFSFPLNRKKYLEYLRNTSGLAHRGGQEELGQEIVLIPFQITASNAAIFSILLFIFTGLYFIWIGINYDIGTVTPKVSFLQSALYMLTFASSVFILSHYSYQSLQRKRWQKNKAERIQRAINLAIENRGFNEFPEVRFLYQFQNNKKFPAQLVVGVSVSGKKYHIFTDSNADELIEVSYVIEE